MNPQNKPQKPQETPAKFAREHDEHGRSPQQRHRGGPLPNQKK